MANNLQPGIHYGVSFADYLALPYFSKSMVGSILRSPKHLRHEIDNPSDCSKAMDFGTLVDCLLLEPETFAARFWTIPATYTKTDKTVGEWTLQSKTCRAALEAATATGTVAVKQCQVEAAKSIVGAVRGHRTASTWLDGKYQVTIVWKDHETGILCKGRPDIFRADRIVDLKSTEDPLPGAFSRTCNNFKYHVQAAMYSLGTRCAETGKYPESFDLPFSFIACESEAPFDVVCYDMDLESLDAGKILFQEAIRKYADCVSSKQWPGYSDYAEPLSIPMWALNKIQLEGVFSE